MKHQLFPLFLLLGLCVFAQTPKEEIQSNRLLSGSNYVAYIAPEKPLSPAPQGYEPFYISHYGRHGSRWLTSDWQYTDVLKVLEKADRYNQLTPKGKELLSQLRDFYAVAKDHIGELTTVGERQHHGIGRRMTEHFPEVFRGEAHVDARSSVVIRCILSMEAEMEELAAFNGNIRFHNDVSSSYQYYLDGDAYKTDEQKQLYKEMDRVKEQYQQRFIHPERLSGILFNDSQWVGRNVDAVVFMQRLFDIAANMQSHDDGLDLYALFTDEECYDLWKVCNIGYYVQYANAPASRGKMHYTQVSLLKNIIATADTLLDKSDFNGATLRFGHEVDIMPLACLLELGNCDTAVADLDNLDRCWANFRIFPMASNIQLVFYRAKKTRKGEAAKPILVKALLNEKEIALPISTDQYPYYNWADLRNYYLSKIVGAE
ncbi:MAG: histidine-type phosphatase [Bacteroidales bacterium]|nr:histidine-type phosphatase [Bacteroidales bacterium]